MKSKNLTIVLFAVAQMSAANFLSAQTASTTPVAPMTRPFGKANLSDILTWLLLLTDTQKAQLQPYVDAVQHELDANHQQARQADDALLKQLCASIRPLLTPEQQTKLDAFEAMSVAGLPPSFSRSVELMFGKGFERTSQ
jgi:Spy/CpxP family protein refolding chaperone